MKWPRIFGPLIVRILDRLPLFKGQVTIYSLPAAEVAALSPKEALELFHRKIKSGEASVEVRSENVVVIGGLGLALDLLRKESGVTGVDYCEMDSGSTAPVSTDTTLETPVSNSRITITTHSRVGLTATFEIYYGAATGNGTWRKASLWGDDTTAASETGTLTAYTLFGTPVVKTSSKAALVMWNISAS